MAFGGGARLNPRLDEVFKEQNITRKAEQLLLLKALGLGKTITQIDGNMKLVNGSIGSIVPWQHWQINAALKVHESNGTSLFVPFGCQPQFFGRPRSGKPWNR